MLIKTAVFEKSSSEVTQLPPSNIPEYAFIGRSNVGKSSLINMLTNHKSLAKTSSTPGKTRLINHFLINKDWYLVDLPGYGYAKASKTARKKWNKLISDYILLRSNLLSVFVLIDVRHAPQKLDTEFIEWLGMSEIPFAIIFTKSDKIGKQKLHENVEHYKTELAKDWEELPQIFITSSSKKQGKDEILDYIANINKIFNKK